METCSLREHSTNAGRREEGEEGEEGPFISVLPQGWGTEWEHSTRCNRASPNSTTPPA